MDPTRRLKLEYNLGLLLVCAGGVIVLLGNKWPGLALVAVGAALYYPASRRRKTAQGEPVLQNPVRRFWGVAVAIVIAAILSPVVLPHLDRHQNWRTVLPVALIVAAVLILILYWTMIRRQSAAKRRKGPAPRDPHSGGPR